MFRRIWFGVVALGVMLALACFAPTTATADDHPIFTVMNTHEGSELDGVWFRDSPQTANTRRITGLGVWAGEQIEALCWERGDAVGALGNTVWYKAINATRPTVDGQPNKGWINTHYVSDGTAVVNGDGGSPADGVSACGPDGSGGATTPPVTAGGSLYYSPYNGPSIVYHYSTLGVPRQKWIEVPSPATTTVDVDQWYTSGCDTSVGHPYIDYSNQTYQFYTTVGAWSLARNEPFLLLMAHPDWRQNIHSIILFDPGNKDDYYTGVCSAKWQQISQAARDWLALDPSNRLTVFAGEITADYGNPVGGYGHAGIQNRLFPMIRDQAEADGRDLRQQVAVCNYDGMSHEKVWMNFRDWLTKPPVGDSCPTAPDGTPSSAGPWHP